MGLWLPYASQSVLRRLSLRSPRGSSILRVFGEMANDMHGNFTVKGERSLAFGLALLKTTVVLIGVERNT
jgi:hypothetical protein